MPLIGLCVNRNRTGKSVSRQWRILRLFSIQIDPKKGILNKNFDPRKLANQKKHGKGLETLFLDAICLAENKSELCLPSKNQDEVLTNLLTLAVRHYMHKRNHQTRNRQNLL